MVDPNMLEQHTFSVNLDFFSGPMDLLLHLVEQQEVPVGEVDMSAIAEQYLHLVATAEYIDLEQAAEYLVIAATLTAIKSHRILPIEQGLEPGMEGFDGVNSEEFYEELRRRLREYELTKKRAVALANTPQLGIDSFSRRGLSLTDRESLIEPVEFQISKGDHLSLGKLFHKVLNRIGALHRAFRIKIDSVSIVSMMMKTIDSLTESVSRRTRFSALIRRFSAGAAGGPAGLSGTLDKNTVIGSFIAILELMKRGVIDARQATPASDIEVELLMAAAGDFQAESEFDAAAPATFPTGPVSIGPAAIGSAFGGLAFGESSSGGTDSSLAAGQEDDSEPELLLAVGAK